jgi:predicted dehydrogenase
MDDKPIRWGLLGTGGICQALAEALAHVPDARLVAVGSRGLERAAAFAARNAATHPGLRALGSYAALVEDPEVDVVYIGTPHTDHAGSALLALQAGKAVLCEKPFTLNLAQAEAVVALARERRLFLMEAMWTRFVPAVAEVRRLVDAGAIGEPLSVRADFGFSAAGLPAEHRALNPALGGGSLLDLGIYPLSLASFLLGPIEAAWAQAQLGPTGVDLHTAFTLRHHGGALSQGLSSLRGRTPWRAQVLGSEGYMELHAPFFHAETFTLVQGDGLPVEHHLPHTGNGYAHQVLEVHRCLRQGLTESPVMTLDESLALMGWLDAIRQQVGLRYPGE